LARASLVRDQLAATSEVISGMSYTSEGGSDYIQLLNMEFKRDLAVVLHNRRIPSLPWERQEPTVFIARTDQLWRIPAFVALRDTAFEDGHWSAGGKRCLGPASAIAGMKLFFHRTAYQTKKPAVRLVPKGLTLARVGLSWKVSRKLFGHLRDWPRSLVTVKISRRLAVAVNAGLRSNVQFLTTRGWR
jgi:hypothetical protein